MVFESLQAPASALLVATNGFPFLEELDQILRIEPSGRFEFPLLLAVDNLSIGVENRKSGGSLIKRDVVLLCEVKVLVKLSDIHMNHVIVRFHQWRHSS